MPVNPANPTVASDLSNITGMAIADTTAADTASVEGLTDIVSQTSIMQLTANAPDAEMAIETTVEVVVETVVDVVGEIVAGVLKE